MCPGTYLSVTIPQPTNPPPHTEPLSHLIYAAADIIVVPSMFEPCGLTQMIAMRYGAGALGGVWVGGAVLGLCVCVCVCVSELQPKAHASHSPALTPPHTHTHTHARAHTRAHTHTLITNTTVPVVRHTGGLRDTVFDVDNDKVR